MPRIDYRGFCTAMNFEYCYLVEAEGNIEIEDIGNVCLRAYNDRAQEYYLLIKNDLGNTQVIEYGPIISDLDSLPRYVKYTYQEVDFSERKMYNIISSFLNDSSKAITQVEIIDESVLRGAIKNMITYVR